ncbi:hypothetical protein R5W24_003610 [Gemmata sp. JC717]|uniref:hypothetical protein n=1 Tax=Gemmata algarum TaxID=2975278 RepID=UPI0021BA974A|nr:hypothetical protein [Gemmata algarum]MDY3554486.1 hypothetical protein [Gemmata algarum]
MGVGLVAMFDPALPAADAFSNGTDGKSVAALLPLLDEIAAAKGLPPFSRFAPDLDEIDWDEADPNDLPDLWFDPAEGLRAVPVLVQALRTEGAWAEQWPERVGEVAECLGLLLRDLEIAKQAGARFSLSFA